MKWVGDTVLGHCVLEKKTVNETALPIMLLSKRPVIIECYTSALIVYFAASSTVDVDSREMGDRPQKIWSGGDTNIDIPQIFCFYFHLCNAIIAISYDWLTSFVFLVLLIFYHASACAILLYTISVCLSIASWYWIIIIIETFVHVSITVKKRTQVLHMLR